MPFDATVVHCRTLLHPLVPQPDGGRIYRCLTEFPGRRPGMIVPVSTLTYELAGGALWPMVGDWEEVVDALVFLAREGGCDALRLGLPQATAAMVANGPNTRVRHYHANGTVRQTGPAEREHELSQLEARVRAMLMQGPFWPGGRLTTPPSEPAVMPYQPV
ncbi:hypothetical protein [Allorhizocola rhizosphaerae]|uniref:hypothetical protein n=1 Tax=Allorhizocola rhizosphaerae TaxID=1872709 RepID=UPI001B8BB424|nr:hypothetical protein [Allorhizocola rhizosphaerae]